MTIATTMDPLLLGTSYFGSPEWVAIIENLAPVPFPVLNPSTFRFALDGAITGSLSTVNAAVALLDDTVAPALTLDAAIVNLTNTSNNASNTTQIADGDIDETLPLAGMVQMANALILVANNLQLSLGSQLSQLDATQPPVVDVSTGVSGTFAGVTLPLNSGDAAGFYGAYPRIRDWVGAHPGPMMYPGNAAADPLGHLLSWALNNW